jgi:hypothetical protein
MPDPATETRLPRLAPLLLVGVLAWLAVARPGKLEVESGTAYLVATTLTAIAVAAYVGWRFHGLIAAAAAACLLWASDQPAATDPVFAERAAEALLLASLGLGIAACSRQGQPRTFPWVVLAVAAVAVAALGWYKLDVHPTADAVFRDRVRHLMFGLAAVTVLVGFTTGGSWRDRAKLVGVAVGAPVAGLIAHRLTRGDWPRLLEGGDWPAVIGEWQGAFAAGTWHAGGWCWTGAWVAVPLVLLGLYRTLARGRRQARQGEAPLAWLVTVASLWAIVALSHRPGSSGSLALVTVGVMLSVFGVADAVLAVVERFQLEPPDPGPSNVPRVK